MLSCVALQVTLASLCAIQSRVCHIFEMFAISIYVSLLVTLTQLYLTSLIQGIGPTCVDTNIVATTKRDEDASMSTMPQFLHPPRSTSSPSLTLHSEISEVTGPFTSTEVPVRESEVTLAVSPEQDELKEEDIVAA